MESFDKAGLFLFAQKLGNAALDAAFADFETHEPLALLLLHELGELVDLLAGVTRPARQAKARDHPSGVHGVLEHLESGVPHHVADIHQFQPEARFRLVAAVAAHGFVVGEPRERRSQILSKQLAENMGHQTLNHAHHVFPGHERHFHVDLGELRLAVGAEILVAKATHDLVVAVEACHHQNLLVRLRRLWQRVEFAAVDAAWHQEVARSLRRAAHQERRFHLDELVLREVRANRLVKPVAQQEVLLHFGSAKVQVAVLEAQLFAGFDPVVDQKRGGACRTEDHQLLGRQLDFPRGQIRIDHPFRAFFHRAGHADHILAFQLAGLAQRVAAHVRVEAHLRDPVAVAQIDEDESTVVTATVDPAVQSDPLARVFRAQFPTGVCSLPGFPLHLASTSTSEWPTFQQNGLLAHWRQIYEISVPNALTFCKKRRNFVQICWRLTKDLQRRSGTSCLLSLVESRRNGRAWRFAPRQILSLRAGGRCGPSADTQVGRPVDGIGPGGAAAGSSDVVDVVGRVELARNVSTAWKTRWRGPDTKRVSGREFRKTRP